MWLRQNKMHVGKWHVKTFMLGVALVLLLLLYLRLQTPQAEGLEGGSRARRQGLIRVHAFGAKPYKSLAYTRRTLAQMRNKTLSEEKNRKGPAKKETPSTLSVAQIPSRRDKPDSAERKALVARNVSRKVAPGRSKENLRPEPLNRRPDQTRRVSDKAPASSQRKEIESQSSREKTLPQSRPSSGFPGSKRAEAAVTVKNKNITAERQTANGSSRGSSPSKQPENRNKNDRIELDRKKSKENSSSKDEDDDDDKDGRMGKSSRPGGHSLTKGKGPSGGNNQLSKTERNINSENKRPLLQVQKSERKPSSTSSKNVEMNDKNKSEKNSKQKVEDKENDKNKDSGRQNSKLRAGLAEDGPRPSPKTTEPKRKHADIKLEEDRLDPDIKTAKKAETKVNNVPETPSPKSDAAASASGTRQEGTEKHERSEGFNDNGSKLAGQDKGSLPPQEETLYKNEANETALETLISKDGTEIELSIITPSSEKDTVPPADSLPTNSSNAPDLSTSNNNTDFTQVTADKTADNKNSDERFYIEGQLRIDRDGNSPGIANMRISRARNGGYDGSVGSDGNPVAYPSYGSTTVARETDDTASNIWNALHAALGSQRAVDITQPRPEQTTTPPFPPKEGFASYQYERNSGDSNDDEEYDSDESDAGDDFVEDYPTGDGSNTSEYDADDVELPDSNEYDASKSSPDHIYYQEDYDKDMRESAQYSDRNRMLSRLTDTERQTERRNLENSVNTNNIYHSTNYMYPLYGQNKFDTLMRISDSQVQQRGDNFGAYPTAVSPNDNYDNTQYTALPGDSQGPDSFYQGATIDPTPVDVTTVSRGETQSQPDVSPSPDQGHLPSDQIPVQEGQPAIAAAAAVQAEEMSSRARQQTQARDQLQRYATLSALTDTEPVEIKPLSRIQKLQKVHTIPL